MRRRIFLAILICVGLCSAELLGPEHKKQKSDEEEEHDDLDILTSSNEEYLYDIKNAVNNQIQELNEYVQAIHDAKKAIEESKGDKDEKDSESGVEKTPDNTLKLMSTIKDLSAMMGQINTNWLDSIIDMQTTRSGYTSPQEDPQDMLNKLPPLPEEPEPELTAEQKEAKELYDEAMVQLKRRSPDLTGSILQVKKAAEMGHVPAKIKLAWSYVYGEGVELDVEKAKEIFETLAADGVADAHAGMGFLYATGISVPVSQARAMLHYTLGALGESWYAQMALGYRRWAGVGTRPDCPAALQLYSRVAARVAGSVSLSGGPAVQRVRLLEEGEGAAASDTDLIEYYQLLADKGDVQAQVGLGQLHLQGGRGVTLDARRALHYFRQAAAQGNPVAHAFLGKIYLEGGDGIKADNETALRYFRKAAEQNNPVGQSGLGLMYLQGRGVQKDPAEALSYFTAAANQGWAEGQLHLGFMHFSGIGVRRDFKLANKYFSLASQSGHVLALYHLGIMHARGLGVMKSCPTALELLKTVCERGPWGSRLMLAHAAHRARDSDSALLQYLSLAEAGIEVAQSNAALLLDSGESTILGSRTRYSRALQLWSRSAAQGYSAARVKLGDYHYYGHGTPVDLEAAAHHYRIAMEQQHNAQAMFNLGYMHERGLGLARDLHLAKRCYDAAADAATDAALPAALALAALHAAQTLAALHQTLLDSPMAVIFLTGDSPLLANWDLYLMTSLCGALAVLLYLRRPRDGAANAG